MKIFMNVFSIDQQERKEREGENSRRSGIFISCLLIRHGSHIPRMSNIEESFLLVSSIGKKSSKRLFAKIVYG